MCRVATDQARSWTATIACNHRLEEADGLLREALELAPRTSEVHRVLGVFLERCGQPEDAEKALW